MSSKTLPLPHMRAFIPHHYPSGGGVPGTMQRERISIRERQFQFKLGSTLLKATDPISEVMIIMSIIIEFLCTNAQSCPTLCDPMDCSPPDSSVHGISQARILEWVAISSRGSSQPRDGTNLHLFNISCIGKWILLSLAPPGK